MYLATGTEPIHMRLALKDNGVLYADLADDSASLGSFNPKDGLELAVTDVDPGQTVASLQVWRFMNTC